MSYLITLLIEIFIISKAVKIVKKAFFNRRKKPKKIFLNSYQKTEIIELNKLEKQRLQEMEKRRKQAIKQAELQEKKRQKQEQAEADIIFYMQQLDYISDLLNSADNELNKIENQIKIDSALNSVDSLKRHEKIKESLIKKIMSYESKIHLLESRLAKANYILST